MHREFKLRSLRPYKNTIKITLRKKPAWTDQKTVKPLAPTYTPYQNK